MKNQAEDTCREMLNVLSSVRQLLTWQMQLVDHGMQKLGDLLGPAASQKPSDPEKPE
jgi:hypothetical protein